jgi:uncharacterized protein (TIGR03382 family)
MVMKGIEKLSVDNLGNHRVVLPGEGEDMWPMEDGGEDPQPPPPPGGCSATAGTSAVALLMLAVLVNASRRRAVEVRSRR